MKYFAMHTQVEITGIVVVVCVHLHRAGINGRSGGTGFAAAVFSLWFRCDTGVGRLKFRSCDSWDKIDVL